METTGGDIYPKEFDFPTSFENHCAKDVALFNYERQPVKVKTRVKALKNIQLNCFKLEAKFYKELNALEMKYENMYKELYERRREIHQGLTEPTEDECKIDFPNNLEHMDQISTEMFDKLKVQDVTNDKAVDTNLAEGDQTISVGIPDFWYTIFRNVALLAERMEDYDWPIIKNLMDVNTVMINDVATGFRLDFTFAPNEFFKNTVLSRSFYVNFDLSESNPMSYDGPEIIMSKGCQIDWIPGKNVTVKNIKFMKKSKTKGEKRSVTRACRTNSFFNFFENVLSKNDPGNDNLCKSPELLERMDSDFEIGQYLRERIIPRAVLFYTGEAIDDEEELDCEYSESDMSESDSDTIHSEHDDGKEETKIGQKSFGMATME